jgi:ATP-dependent DNA helicase PIF1
MFLAWFNANLQYEEGRNLLYSEFPTKFVFHQDIHAWKPRKRGFSIGRLTYVPVGAGELYYLRILLTKQRGCTSYEDIRTVKGIVYNTFQEACSELGLLKDDQEFKDALKESHRTASGYQMRCIFVRMLNMNTMSNPYDVWKVSWKLLADGILYNRRKALKLPGIKLYYQTIQFINAFRYIYLLNLCNNCVNVFFNIELQISDDELENLCLIEIDKLLMLNGRSLSDYKTMPTPVVEDGTTFQNKLIADELSYDRVELGVLHASLLKQLTEEQHVVYTKIMTFVLSNDGKFYFLYGYGGTGKTFLWKTLSAALREQGKIVVNVASS